ncbi:protein 5NUC-like [Macrosteles quadrilineatus]|uniref:protein 5NUC-like n=1 Tax=Macrosteles quadrilineatus TaxID=74068 RepID=UPI0023E2486D|nr:protein 5NUC-like [Macrosteles quadrilineatus]
MHAQFQAAHPRQSLCPKDSPQECYGGFARVKATVDAKKKAAAQAGRPTIFLNAGDTFQGTPYYTFFKWPIVSQFVDMLGIDVMALGNHEFDDGVKSLSEYIEKVSVPNVCSNLDLSQEPSMQVDKLTPSFILTVNNVKIGVIGYLTPDTKLTSDVGKVNILDEIPSIRKEAQRLRAENVKILIALGHSGYAKDQQIAKEVEEIDLVVGGHSHTLLYKGTPPDPNHTVRGDYPTVITQASGKKVPVVQASYGTRYLGYLELDFDDEGNLKSWNGAPILLSGDLPQDPDVLAALQPYEKQLDDKLGKVVGNTVKYTNSQGWTVASVAIQQAGGIRASINQRGPITAGNVVSILPWGGKIVVKELRGSVLLDVLETQYTDTSKCSRGPVGLKVVYNMQAAPGSRVVSVQVRCAELPSTRLQCWRISLMEGDGFSMLTNIPNTYIFDDVDYVVLTKYVEKHSPVYPAVEGRIVILNAKQEEKPSPVKKTLRILRDFFRHMHTFNGENAFGE